MHLDKLETVKAALLDLVRIMRIARTGYKKRAAVPAAAPSSSVPKPAPDASVAAAPTLASIGAVPERFSFSTSSASGSLGSELSGLRKSPSIHTLNLMERIQAAPAATLASASASSSSDPAADKDLNMIRERLEKLLNAISKVLRDDQKDVSARFKALLANPSGFFWDSNYANTHVLHVVNAPSCAAIVEAIYVQLTVRHLTTLFSPEVQ